MMKALVSLALALVAQEACVDTKVPLGNSADTREADTREPDTHDIDTPDVDTSDVDRCATVAPERLHFRAPTGHTETLATMLSACGTAPVTIESVALIGDTPGMFAIELDEDGPVGVVLQPHESTPIVVHFTPTSLTPGGSHDVTLRVTTDGRPAVLDILLEGVALTDMGCPQAVITCREGDRVEPQTTVHCSASESIGRPGREVVGYAWSVEQPGGSVEVIRPSTAARDIELTTNVVGHYELELTVYDDSGAASCVPARHRFAASSYDTLHVELLWHTPGDDDETDTGNVSGFSVGTDMDLHLVQGDAAWFDSRYDTFFLNPNPNWATVGSIDDPSLDRDDVDGAGPESLSLDYPIAGTTYRVGVHYFDDWGYGRSEATVRIYINGQLRWQGTADLVMSDLWEVATITWPDTTVTSIQPAPHIISDFPADLSLGASASR